MRWRQYIQFLCSACWMTFVHTSKKMKIMFTHYSKGNMWWINFLKKYYFNKIVVPYFQTVPCICDYDRFITWSPFFNHHGLIFLTDKMRHFNQVLTFIDNNSILLEGNIVNGGKHHTKCWSTHSSTIMFQLSTKYTIIHQLRKDWPFHQPGSDGFACEFTI